MVLLNNDEKLSDLICPGSLNASRAPTFRRAPPPYSGRILWRVSNRYLKWQGYLKGWLQRGSPRALHIICRGADTIRTPEEGPLPSGVVEEAEEEGMAGVVSVRTRPLAVLRTFPTLPTPNRPEVRVFGDGEPPTSSERGKCAPLRFSSWKFKVPSPKMGRNYF